ncbi:DNA-binding MarR family transcriptional regulator [Lacrimispora xylanisolvens]|uniref:DNA-binding MarR family transcriptional regulator n=1 Tax=Lacrimispora xylanisolvens TaxID=384636 RepID=A0A2S6HP56_9FIRM|nr:MarR family winged helix-turn-helix transcriptional regulator [Hungatella xylanolytica]PPK79313.1 DNA-binding MarR family transcriptional regulator [Hungatella xylanolytica]
MGNEPMNLMMLNSKIYRNTQSYLDKVLKQYDLSSGSFRYLFVMEKNEGLCQSRISELIGHDKAMSARTISRLTEVGYVVKIEDQLDSRAYKLYLTDKARLILPQIREEINKLIELITGDLTAEEKEITLFSLVKILNKALELNT